MICKFLSRSIQAGDSKDPFPEELEGKPHRLSYCRKKVGLSTLL